MTFINLELIEMDKIKSLAFWKEKLESSLCTSIFYSCPQLSEVKLPSALLKTIFR